MPKLAARSQLADDTRAPTTAAQMLDGLKADARSRLPLSDRQRALVEWLGAGREAVEEEERAQWVHEERKARRLGLVARSGLLAGYPDDANGWRSMRRDLDKPNVLVARLRAAQRAVLDAQDLAVGRLVDLSQNANTGSEPRLLRLCLCSGPALHAVADQCAGGAPHPSARGNRVAVAEL